MTRADEQVSGGPFDLVVSGGALVLQDGVWPGDVGIRGEKIVALAGAGSLHGEERIDAHGLLVFPGLVDPHVHLGHRVSIDGEVVEADDTFLTGTQWAAAGGTTTVIDFAPQGDLDPVEAAIARRDAIAAEAVTDFGLHVVLTKSVPTSVAAIPRLVDMGVPSVKVYMIYRRQGRMADDGMLLATLREASRAGALVAVHAENDAIFEWNLARLTEAGDLAADAFPRSKPQNVETEAVARAIFLAKIAGAPIYIVHVSTRDAAAQIAAAQHAGQAVYAETCPHYLVLDESVYQRPDGHRFICSPPIRGRQDVEGLWRAISEGVIDVVGSDHCGFAAHTKDSRSERFPMVPNGLPGVGLRLPVLYSFGIIAGRIDLPRLSGLLSTNPARRFGLWPWKGSLMPGADADLVLVDPKLRQRVRTDDLDTPIDWTPFDEYELTGWARVVVSRGVVIARDGRSLAKPGRGRFIARTAAARAHGNNDE
jgi:dihydropyrimidinase